MLILAPLVAMLFANGILTIAQTSISSVYLPISVTFDEQITGLGVLSSLFFIGLGLVEAPGGILTSRIGPKKVLLAGSTMVTLAVLVSAYSPTFDVLAVFRFIVGVGLGLAIPSMIVITMRTLGKGSSGMGVALFSAASCIGAFLGLPGWSILAAIYGWRSSLLLDAAITGGITLMVFFMVPSESPSVAPRIDAAGLQSIFANRRIQILSLAFFGAGVTGVLTGSFMVYYLEKVFDLAPGYAGTISGVAYIAPIFTGVIVGRLYDRGMNAKYIIFGATVTLGLGTALVAIHSLYAALAGVLLCGMSGSPIGVTVFAATTKLTPDPELQALTIGIVDSVSLMGVFVGAFIFPFMVLGLGYPLAWALGGTFCIILTAPVLFFNDL